MKQAAALSETQTSAKSAGMLQVLELLRQKKFILAGILDAGLIAGSGFLVNVMSGRFLSTEAYAVFVILYTVSSIALIFQSALIASPYVVLSQSVDSKQLPAYFSGTLLMTMVLGILLGTMSALGISFVLPQAQQGVVALMLLFGTYIMLNMMQDFMRRVYYSEKREMQALILDGFSYGGQVVALLAFHKHLDLRGLFMMLGGTTLLALSISFGLNIRWLASIFRQVRSDELWAFLKNAVLSNWHFGKWLLSSSLISWMASQFYVLIIGGSQPVLAIAQFGAARTIAAISNPLVLAYEALAMPRISQIFHQKNFRLVRRFVFSTASLGGLGFILLGGGLFCYPSQSIHLLFGKSFGEMSLLVRIFSVFPFIWFISKVFSIALLGLHRPKALLPVYVISCLFTVTIGIWMTKTGGVVGASWGLLASSLILMLGFIVQFLRQMRTIEKVEPCV